MGCSEQQSSVIHMSLMLRSGLRRRAVIVVIFINDQEDQQPLQRVDVEKRNESTPLGMCRNINVLRGCPSSSSPFPF